MADTGQGLYFHVNWGRMAVQRAIPKTSAHLAALSLQSIAEPEALPAGWVTLKPRMSGICGSDMTLMKGQSSPYLRPLTSFPAVLGHEIVAEASGTRVVVEPSLSCGARRLPPCQMCAMGLADDCLRRTDPALGPGLMLGYHARLPGGWGDRLWAPEEQLVAVPDDMPDARAVLTEPAAIVLTGLRRVEWQSVKDVLVIGAGTIGLLAVALISELYPATDIVALAKYPHQARMAMRMGAKRVADANPRHPALLPVLGESWPTLPGYPPYFPRGFDVVVVAAGNASAVTEASVWLKPDGQMLMLGGVGSVRLDWTPVWSRHLRVVGSYGYGEAGVDTFRAILSLFSVMRQPLEALVTHQYALKNYRQALATVLGRRSEAIKTVFTPT